MLFKVLSIIMEIRCGCVECDFTVSFCNYNVSEMKDVFLLATHEVHAHGWHSPGGGKVLKPKPTIYLLDTLCKKMTKTPDFVAHVGLRLRSRTHVGVKYLAVLSFFCTKTIS